MRQTIKEKMGITLIALVITIIVLIILAGVTIAFLTGDNGIFTQMAKANFYTEMQAINEQKDLSKIESFMNQKIDNNNSSLQVENNFLGENLGKNQETVNIVKNFTDTLKAEIVFARNNVVNTAANSYSISTNINGNIATLNFCSGVK